MPIISISSCTLAKARAAASTTSLADELGLISLPVWEPDAGFDAYFLISALPRRQSRPSGPCPSLCHFWDTNSIGNIINALGLSGVSNSRTGRSND
jgi:hypothetical protein